MIDPAVLNKLKRKCRIGILVDTTDGGVCFSVDGRWISGWFDGILDALECMEGGMQVAVDMRGGGTVTMVDAPQQPRHLPPTRDGKDGIDRWLKYAGRYYD